MLMLVVDGRQTFSRGYTMVELANLMIDPRRRGRAEPRRRRLLDHGRARTPRHDRRAQPPSDGFERHVANGARGDLHPVATGSGAAPPRSRRVVTGAKHSWSGLATLCGVTTQPSGPCSTDVGGYVAADGDHGAHHGVPLRDRGTGDGRGDLLPRPAWLNCAVNSWSAASSSTRDGVQVDLAARSRLGHDRDRLWGCRFRRLVRGGGRRRLGGGVARAVRGRVAAAGEQQEHGEQGGSEKALHGHGTVAAREAVPSVSPRPTGPCPAPSARPRP